MVEVKFCGYPSAVTLDAIKRAQASAFKSASSTNLLEMLETEDIVGLQIGKRTHAIAVPTSACESTFKMVPKLPLARFKADPYKAVRCAFFTQRALAVGEVDRGFLLAPRVSKTWAAYAPPALSTESSPREEIGSALVLVGETLGAIRRLETRIGRFDESVTELTNAIRTLDARFAALAIAASGAL